MNKTIEYAVNEALKIGRLSANVKFYEAELREVIAQEIEASREKYIELCKDKESENYQFNNGVCNGMFLAIMLAKGKNAY